MTDCTGGTVEEFSKVRKSIVAVQYFRVNRYFFDHVCRKHS